MARVNQQLRERFAGLAGLLSDKPSPAWDAGNILILLGRPRIGKSYTILYHLFQRYCLGEQVFHLSLMAPDVEIEQLLKRLHVLRAGDERAGHHPLAEHLAVQLGPRAEVLLVVRERLRDEETRKMDWVLGDVIKFHGNNFIDPLSVGGCARTAMSGRWRRWNGKGWTRWS